MTAATQTARYFVFTRHGRAIVSVERDCDAMDRATTVRDLIDGQIEDVTAVWCAEDSRFYDASEEIAQAIADEAAKHGIELGQPLLAFIAEHVGLRSAYALGMEAA